ncbi:hypothetical protein WA026_009197 [Henosepilachna vigintioctopunctata]|uniref:Fatty acid desaturase domain-containing protein n=1 Tax=Henosepilachna vigintioctopunctata TaxID=420089 RepID=A0AAW1UWU0_9CUCU
MGKKLEFRDILDDPVVSFQKKHIRSMVVLIAIIIPTAIPIVLWGETFTNAFCLNFLRHFISLHAILAVNSVTHAYGKKPYDRHIRPTENKLISFLSSGEGFHNYHHAFPWDYKASELGNYSLNFTTSLIDFFAKIGWAYDLKSPTEEMVKNKCLKKAMEVIIYGDGETKTSPKGVKPSDCKLKNIVLVPENNKIINM